jgi:hypothetical protein
LQKQELKLCDLVGYLVLDVIRESLLFSWSVTGLLVLLFVLEVVVGGFVFYYFFVFLCFGLVLLFGWFFGCVWL